MKHLRKVAAIIVAITVLSSMCLAGSVFSASASGTGAGLAEWAMNAYYSGWAYVYGGSSPGAVDCSGLIYSYAGGDRTGDAQLGSSSSSGSVSSGIPRIHGLGLYQPGHVGVYVGNGMAVDARNESEGVCYSSVDYMGWSTWFKLGNVTYPSTGWEEFNGNYYYYENGEYIVNTSRTIDGVTYYFGSDGVSDTTPSDTSSTAEDNSSYSDNYSGNSSESSDNSSESNKPSYETIQLGSQGDNVTKLQERLQELGFYKGEITGNFDEATQKAYIAFQTAAGVTVDGISGASDQELLYSDNAPYAPEEPQQDEETTKRIQSAQEKLKALNYYCGVCDGFIGDLSSEAIKAFQLDNDLEATGELNDATYEAIMSDDAKENPIFASSENTLQPTSFYTYNAYQLNSSGIMGPSPAVDTATTSSFILPNAVAQDNTSLANNVAAKTNQLAKNAVSNFASQGFTSVGPMGTFKFNGLAVGLFAVVFVISLISVYMLIRTKKEKARKAARAALRAERHKLQPVEESRYWW